MVNREINSVDNQINSYLNEDIVRLIFKKLPINELKNARIVCHLWNNIILGQLHLQWYKLKPIELHTDKEISRLLRSFRNSMVFNYRNKLKSFQCSFVMKMGLLKLPPEFFTIFSIKYLKLSLGSEIIEECELDFDFFASNILPRIAPNLEEFEIIINNESKVKFVIPCVFESLHLSCPNLKKINFSTVSREANSRLFLAILFQEISSNAPKLKSVKILYKANKYHKNSLSAFTTTSSLNLMKETQLSRLIPQIEQLSLYDYDKSVLEDLLRVSNSQKLRRLKSLEVHLNLIREPGITLLEEVQNLYEILLKVAKTLEELSLQTLAINCEKKSKRTILIPRLERCTKLKLINYDLNDDQKIINDVSNYFTIDLDSFPHLFEVELTYFSTFDTLVNSISWSNCPFVKILGIIFIQVSDGQTGKLVRNHKTPNFTELVKFFPNVSTLKVTCSDNYKGFKDTFIPWVKLKELIVHFTPSDFEAYNFYRIIHLKDLTRIELYNSLKETKISHHRNKLVMPQFETMKKLNLKHLKIVNFKILMNILKIFDNKYNFEYRCIDDNWIGADHPEENKRKIIQTGGYYIT